MKPRRRITVLDTTLRDGDQSPGFALSSSAKLKLAAYLERLGVDIIEAGFPASSRAQFKDVSAIASMVEDSAVSVMARSVKKDIDCAARAIKTAKRGMIHLSLATSAIHREFKLEMSRSEVIDTAVKSIRYAKGFAGTVEMGAEDATRTEFEFLAEFCSAAAGAGAGIINISDTVGYAQPAEFARLIRALINTVPEFQDGTSVISVHCHNDLGLATANTLAGIESGASQIECTLLGIGERAGNAPIEETVTAIASRPDYYINLTTNVKPALFPEGAELVRAATGIDTPPNKAVIGRNTRVHASGIHQDGMIADPETYSIIQRAGFPDSFRFVLSRHSGSSGVRHIVNGITGIDLSDGDLSSVTAEVKEEADLAPLVSQTDLLRILRRKKIISNEVWHVTSCEHSSDGGSVSISLTLKGSDGGIHSSGSKGTSPSAVLLSMINGFFAADIRIRNLSHGSVVNDGEANGFVHLVAVNGNRQYHTERHGKSDHIRYIAECLIDAVNQILIKEASNGSAHKEGNR